MGKPTQTFKDLHLDDGKHNTLEIEVWDDKEWKMADLMHKKQQLGHVTVDIKKVFGVHYPNTHPVTLKLIDGPSIKKLGKDTHKPGSATITISGKWEPKPQLPLISKSTAAHAKGGTPKHLPSPTGS